MLYCYLIYLSIFSPRSDIYLTQRRHSLKLHSRFKLQNRLSKELCIITTKSPCPSFSFHAFVRKSKGCLDLKRKKKITAWWEVGSRNSILQNSGEWTSPLWVNYNWGKNQLKCYEDSKVLSNDSTLWLLFRCLLDEIFKNVQISQLSTHIHKHQHRHKYRTQMFCKKTKNIFLNIFPLKNISYDWVRMTYD